MVPVSEQQVFAADHDAAAGQLAAVYPSDGSPDLDYPVLRVGSPPAADRAAVTAVVAALTSPQARAAARAAGFRTPGGAPPPGAGPTTGISATAPRQLRLDPKDVAGLIAHLSSLAAPSRLLAVFDVSTSMRQPGGPWHPDHPGPRRRRERTRAVPRHVRHRAVDLRPPAARRTTTGTSCCPPARSRPPPAERPSGTRSARARQPAGAVVPRRHGPLRHDPRGGPGGAGRLPARLGEQRRDRDRRRATRTSARSAWPTWSSPCAPRSIPTGRSR